LVSALVGCFAVWLCSGVGRKPDRIDRIDRRFFGRSRELDAQAAMLMRQGTRLRRGCGRTPNASIVSRSSPIAARRIVA
jgi:hypothetical protein